MCVCLSVMLMYRGRIGWVSSKVNIRIISLWFSLLGDPTSAILSNGITPKFGWNRGTVLFCRKPSISLKRPEGGQIRPKLLLMTNKKSHTRFRLEPKSTTLDDLERPLCTLFENTCVFEANHKNLNKDKPILSAAKM